MAEFFQNNLLIISIFYSFTYFIIFFAVVFQKRHMARFDLTNTFIYLAGFGLTHGTGDFLKLVPSIFVLDQAQGLFVILIAKYLKIVSFILLYLFGLSVFLDNAKYKGRWVIFSAPIIALAIFLTAFDPFAYTANFTSVHKVLLGFPSAVLASVALMKMSVRFKRLNLIDAVVNFRGAAAAFLLYGVFGGLLAVSYPESVMVSGVPVQLLRALALITVAFFTIRIMSAFKL